MTIDAAANIPVQPFWARAAMTWLAYVLSGALSVVLTSPADQVAPFYLAAGVGLACVLSWGAGMLPMVALGSATVEWLARWLVAPEALGAATVLPVLISGVGGGLQAGMAWQLTRRLARPALVLENPRDIGLFLLLAGPMASLINPALSVTALVMTGELPEAQALDTFLNWWMGDAMGVMVGAPMALTLIGQPADLWRGRRRTVGVPLLITALVVMGVARQVQSWKTERAEHLFQRDLASVQHSIERTLAGYLNTLEALRGLYQASESVDRQEFETASRYWLATVPGIQGVGWDQRIRRDELPAFEARQRADGQADYRVFDTHQRRAPQGDELVPVTYFEPLAGNAAALGYNVLSMPATKDAFEQARREDKVVATAPLTLNQETAQQLSTVVYRAVYRGSPHTPLQRVQATQGAVFVALHLGDMVRTMLRDLPPHLQACLVDMDGGGRGRPVFLAGAAECREASALPSGAINPQWIPLKFAERPWSMRVWQTSEHPALAGDHMPRLIAAGGMALTAALGGLLLMMTGHARRIEAAMQDARAQKQAADAANRAKSEFLSRMSHELRTPLNAVLGFAQVLELEDKEPLQPGQRQRIQQIQQAGWHLLAMIDDVLDISRVDTGTLQLDMKPSPLGDVVSAAMDLAEPMAMRHQVSLVRPRNIPTDWWVTVDRTRLQQVLSNLLSNAIKYNRPGGQVSVRAELLPRQGRIAERLVVTVEDNGLGMSQAQVAQLFQPFNRLGREHSGTDGTGIGLVITRHLVQAMDGVLQVRSEEGQGSAFSVTLTRVQAPDGGQPAARADRRAAPASAATPAPPPVVSAPTTAAGRPGRPQRHVLYVEDNAANSAVIQSALASRSWLRLTVTPTIEEGLAVLHDRVRGRQPDLILLDVHLPDASGLELLHLLKANPDTAGIPVIMISADAMPEQIDAALSAGAACYLTKPVQIAALLVQVDELLSG
ncbi:CHASE domain-containing protein [Aquabacterium sp. A3]|uniref:CHASE domain-containing protein n=1 Tax=Aquabacterium sp. A3 TaxID=3132829 RepID=UPI003119A2B3